jgi:hypothetical protein
VAGFDDKDLLGPAAGLSADDKQVTKLLVLDLAEDPSVLLGRDDYVASTGPRVLDVADGVSMRPHADRQRSYLHSLKLRPQSLVANRQRIASFFPPDHRSANVVPNRQRIAQVVTLRTASALLSFVWDLSP